MLYVFTMYSHVLTHLSHLLPKMGSDDYFASYQIFVSHFSPAQGPESAVWLTMHLRLYRVLFDHMIVQV